MEAEGGFFAAYVGSALCSCMFMGLVLYNLYGLFSYSREDTGDERASGFAKAAWALSFFAFLLGPCSWVGALTALIIARVERGRMYAEKSPLAGATLLRIAGVNAGVTILQWLVITAAMSVTWMQNQP